MTCQVGFKEGYLQRQHHKSDWHWYNLKRKVVDLPPVSPDEFKKKVVDQKVIEPVSQQFYCSACRKKFSSDNMLASHKRSKKHLHMTKDEDDADSVISNTLTEKERIQKMDVEKDIVSEASVSEAATDDWEEFEGLGINECLFCSHWSSSLDKNVTHMTRHHSFFIPDAEFLSDITGFVTYLGVKVGADHECLKCGNQSREFRSLEAVQKHMVDKGHSIINTEGNAYLEYGDYYDFSASYPDGDNENSEEVASKSQNSIRVDDDLSLVLPSGARVGHRSLKIYYTQNLPIEVRNARNKRGRLDLLRQYKAIGWHGEDKVMARFEKRAKMREQKDRTRLAVKANKFQTHFRPQVIF